jgi:hypothetical protein
MAIDRGPWNALVDDDGSNLTGSLWNKAAIKTVLLDPIDALVTPIGVWQAVPFNAANFGGMTVTAAQVVTNRYTLFGKTVLWNLGIENTTVVGTPISLTVTLPGLLPAAGGAQIVEMLAAGAWVAGRASVQPGSPSVAITQLSYAAFSAAFYLHALLIIEVQ